MSSYILIVLLLMGSAFFSGTEIAFTSLNRLRLKKENEKATKAEKLVLYISNHFEHALSTVLIGNNLVNIGATSIATVLAVNLAAASQGKLSDQTASSVVTVVMTILILIVGEITPKMLAKRYNEAFIKIACWPLMVLMVILSPAVFVSTAIVNLFSLLWRKKDDEKITITEEDLESILDVVEDEGIIDENQTELLQSALEFNDQEACDILTPRIDVIGFEINDSLEKVLEIIHESEFSRYPVYDRTIDHVVGVIYVKHLLRELVEKGNDVQWQSLMLDHIHIPESMKLNDIMDEFRTKQMHMAIVADEYGGTAGIVTMEDVLEQLVGEIWDENDDIVADWQQISETRYECSGDMNLSEFCDELDLDEEELGSDCATVGGWATDEIGALPVEFDAFDFKNMTIIVKAVNESHRIEKLIVLLHNCEKDD